MTPARSTAITPTRPEEDTLTTATRTKRTTTTAPEFPTAEQIAAQVHEHGAEERRDQEAAEAMHRLARKAHMSATDPEPDVTAAYEDARVSGGWDAFEAVIREHVEWTERDNKRLRVVHALRDRTRPVDPERRIALRADAGRLTLDYLAQSLPSILAAAQALDLAGVPASAEAVLNAGPEMVERFGKARAVVDAYSALRRAQAVAVRNIAAREVGGGTDMGVSTTGQFRDALHLDATWLSNRRNGITLLNKDATRNHVRRFAPGAEEFFDNAPDPLFGSITADGFPAECKTIPARAAWLKKWAGRLEFFVPDFDQLHLLHRAYSEALDVRNWKDRRGLVVQGDINKTPLPDDVDLTALVNLTYVRPDWDATPAEDVAQVADAAQANRQAARMSEHPGYAH